MNSATDSPNLDLLRTLAVSYVVIFHLLLFIDKTNLGLLWSIGHWGVLLFFVHTSLVLMFSLERQESRSPATNIFWPFYVRRCFRILPLSALIVSIIACTAIPVGHLYLGHFRAVHLHIFGIICNLLLVQNFAGVDSITAPLWSLPYEMQMYLIFPVLYLLVRSVRSVKPVIGIWFTIAIAIYITGRLFHGSYPTFLALVPCFMAGVVSYKLSKVRLTKMPFVGWPLLIALTTYLYLRRPTPQRSWIWCLLIGVSLPLFSEMSNRWLQKACHYVARYSYGIYLVHFICIWFAFVELSKLSLALRWVFFAAITIVIPIALYHLVESPMINLGRKIAKPTVIMTTRERNVAFAEGQ